MPSEKLSLESVMALAGREFDKAVLVAMGYPARKIFAPDWGDADNYHFIPSGKPKRTHMIDAVPVPAFHREASADYEVLKRVRETWDEDARERFDVELNALLIQRAAEQDGALSEVCYYQTSDYGRAALLALLGPGRRGESGNDEA